MSNHDEFFEDLDALDLAQSIRQEREAFLGCFLILEGKNDNRTLRSQVDESACSIQVAGSKKLALEVLNEIENEGFEDVVCVIDTDYEYTILENSISENVIKTDAHDLDVLIFSSSAFDRYILERCDGKKVESIEKLHKKTIREIIYEAALPIGCLRLLSYRNARNIKLNFSKLSFDFVDESTLQTDISALLNEVLNASRKQILAKKEIEDRYQIVLRQTHDPKLVCQGHDISSIISVALRSCLANFRNPYTGRPDPRSWSSEVEMLLRLSFGREQFEETNLYKELLAWEKRNRLFSVLRKVNLSTKEGYDPALV